MEYLAFRNTRVIVLSLFILLMPIVAYAQSGQRDTLPLIAQQLVPEGIFAVKLQSALGLGSNEDEITAESHLGDAGIAPQNGWISDYPMTPDIIIELLKEVDNASKEGKLPVSNDKALTKFHEVATDLNLSIEPYASNQGNAQSSSPENYPDSAEINNFYYNDGPPVVTYYIPPDDYFYMYTWVPYPFWCSDYWFPGFFILHDFHRIVVADHRAVFISNYFHGFRGHKDFHDDVPKEFHGKSFVNPDVSQRRDVIPSEVLRGGMHVFNGSHIGVTHSGSMMGYGGFHGGGDHR